MPVELREHQEEALQFLDNGKVLYGGTGSGKSVTACAYYVRKEAPRDIIVITTAKKRDKLEWDEEFSRFGIGKTRTTTTAGTVTIDSWNNIKNYVDVEDHFFIFDEQRLVGHGAWVKSFLKIVKRNHWIVLSATPGDTWLDYAPIFIANGYFRNITQFKREHVLYAPYIKFPKVIGFLHEAKLNALRNEVLVEMAYVSHAERFINRYDVGYDKEMLAFAQKKRWHPYEARPLKDSADLWRLMRKMVYSDPSRIEAVRDLMKLHPRLIIFYNFDYELEILRDLDGEVSLAEWNGHRKQEIPDEERWVYLVQYTAGAEGWNCISTDAMILYSLTYSYKRYRQAQGRIDRLNSPFNKLYYWLLMSNTSIDKAVWKALDRKKNFNERDVEKVLKEAA